VSRTVTVKTLTANVTDCSNNCPAKPLAQYVSENAAYAGMNGTYLCPPDYAQCAGKVNSYDYAVYNSNLRRWINYTAVNAQNGGLFFNGASTSVYRRTYVYYQNQTPITAAITNFPLLVQNGAVIDSTAEQNGSQLLKGTKGAIGVDGTYVYLAIVTNATVSIDQPRSVPFHLKAKFNRSRFVMVHASYRSNGLLRPGATAVVDDGSSHLGPAGKLRALRTIDATTNRASAVRKATDAAHSQNDNAKTRKCRQSYRHCLIEKRVLPARTFGFEADLLSIGVDSAGESAASW